MQIGKDVEALRKLGGRASSNASYGLTLGVSENSGNVLRQGAEMSIGQHT